MKTMLLQTRRFAAAWLVERIGIRSERGATAVEYGIMVAAIAAVIVAVVFVIGQQTNEGFTTVCTELDTQPSITTSCP